MARPTILAAARPGAPAGRIDATGPPVTDGANDEGAGKCAG
jgi:hypothetical protein